MSPKDKNPWQPIETAPCGGAQGPISRINGPALDIVVKRWDAKSDEFKFDIFRNVKYAYGLDGSGGWSLSTGYPLDTKKWRPMKWVLSPVLPSPPTPEEEGT